MRSTRTSWCKWPLRAMRGHSWHRAPWKTTVSALMCLVALEFKHICLYYGQKIIETGSKMKLITVSDHGRRRTYPYLRVHWIITRVHEEVAEVIKRDMSKYTPWVIISLMVWLEKTRLLLIMPMLYFWFQGIIQILNHK